MKHLRRNKDFRHWWVGEIVECGFCGDAVELEVGDENSDYLASWTPLLVRVECPRCAAMMVKRSEEVDSGASE